MSLRFAYEKFNTALLALVSLDESLSARLEIAISEVTLIVPDRDLPPDFRKAFRQLAAKIQIYRQDGNSPDLPSEIALSILDIFKQLVGFSGMV